jgi:MFS family permease
MKNSAFGPLSKAYGISVTEASYSTTIAIVMAGIAPLVYSPISNLYGRRPVYIFSTAIGIAACAGSAVAQTWGTLMVSRIFVGIGTSGTCLRSLFQTFLPWSGEC